MDGCHEAGVAHVRGGSLFSSKPFFPEESANKIRKSQQIETMFTLR
jgi:hypothetical protein